MRFMVIMCKNRRKGTQKIPHMQILYDFEQILYVHTRELLYFCTAI